MRQRMRRRVEAACGIEHHRIEGLQQIDWRVGRVEEGEIRLRRMGGHTCGHTRGRIGCVSALPRRGRPEDGERRQHRRATTRRTCPQCAVR
jgi:hypothetical protein